MTQTTTTARDTPPTHDRTATTPTAATNRPAGTTQFDPTDLASMTGDADASTDRDDDRELSTGRDDDRELSTVAALLADEHGQRVLAATSVEPKSRRELADACDASLQTVSRRVDDLVAADLLREATRARRDGHHDAVYVATLDRFEVRLRDGDLEVDVARMDRDMTDELQRLWSKFSP